MAGRKELLSTIEKQREQIEKYEAKFKDVVRAYKGLLKEKEALKASLTALTPGDHTSTGNEAAGTEVIPGATSSDSAAVGYKTAATDEYIKEHENESEEPHQECENSVLQTRLNTLTKALATVTSEKDRVEASFQTDKRRLLAEKEKLEQLLNEERESQKKCLEASDDKLRELRSRIIILQHERDQVENNNAAMFRELESKLAAERSSREKLEALLEESREQQRQITSAFANTRTQEQQQKQMTDLQNELEQVRSRLKRAEKQCENPAVLKKLQKQMGEMRSQHEELLCKERVRAEKAEKIASDQAQAHEERVAVLEARLTELSHAVAAYDRTRQAQLDTISSLKEKMGELAQENYKLSAQTSTANTEVMEADTDINALLHKFTCLWEKIQVTSITTMKPLDIEDLLPGHDALHRRCHREYDELKSEFESYKAIARQKEENRESGKCHCDLQEQVEDLREKIRSLTTATRLTQDMHLQQVATLEKKIAAERAKSAQLLQDMEQEHRVAIADLEQQLASQRHRSLATLQDRDEEIHRLTQELHNLSKLPSESSTVAAALLSQVRAGGTDGPLLHHLEEMARKDMEISLLRREKRELEKTMRDIQMASLDRQEVHQDTISRLKDEVERYKRNSSREGENLEYLKNVIHQYMISSDADSRGLMLNAIAAVLKFTEEEVDSVRKYNALWWWQSVPKPRTPKSH